MAAWQCVYLSFDKKQEINIAGECSTFASIEKYPTGNTWGKYIPMLSFYSLSENRIKSVNA
jgi:hypothetical protein